jgi:hypothetical protein
MSDYDSWRIEALNDKNSELDDQNDLLRIKIKELNSKIESLEKGSTQNNGGIDYILKYNKLKIDFESLTNSFTNTNTELQEVKKDRDIAINRIKIDKFIYYIDENNEENTYITKKIELLEQQLKESIEANDILREDLKLLESDSKKKCCKIHKKKKIT